MYVPWKLKSTIFRIIDVLGAHQWVSFLSKYVTRRAIHHARRMNPDWVTHKRLAEKYLGDKIPLLFEFGAGKNLKQNLYLSQIADHQILYDLANLADIDLINTAITDLKRRGILDKDANYLGSLSDLTSYGIEYFAPADARNTHLESDSIDVCVSTDTLEHIPRDDLILIFRELKRILKPDGIVIAKIDYTDHYSHTDPFIPMNNFHTFSEDEWKRYNHVSHYQNRLSHDDYLGVFEQCAFEVMEQEVNSILLSAGESDPADQFISSAFFVLRKHEN